MTYYLGLMSGTSMDGIDAALVDLPTNQFIAGLTKAYSEEVQRRLAILLNEPTTTLEAVYQLNSLIGREFASAATDLLDRVRMPVQEIRAIGSHGQTVIHNPFAHIPYTVQLGCAHTLSALTGITVVADFRTRDLVHGGQGAPFAPIYHAQLFGQDEAAKAVVNLGGIANISFIRAKEPIRGWDVGPGNCLLDAWIQKHLGKAYDKDGAWAASGQLIEPLLTQLMADPYLRRASPKSIGKEYYSLAWLESFLEPRYKLEDVQATLLVYTASCIAEAVRVSKLSGLGNLYLCGGGTHNTCLRNKLSELLPGVLVESCATLGVDPDYLEAMMFAWFAHQALERRALDLSSVTGSREAGILGAVYPVVRET